MDNFWLVRANKIYENEVILVRQSNDTRVWFDRMPSQLPAICPIKAILTTPEDFAPKIGIAHHIRLTKFGIEGILKAPKKYHKLSLHVLYNKTLQPNEPFWVVLA